MGDGRKRTRVSMSLDVQLVGDIQRFLRPGQTIGAWCSRALHQHVCWRITHERLKAQARKEKVPCPPGCPICPRIDALLLEREE
jgi:hypothetical protein